MTTTYPFDREKELFPVEFRQAVPGIYGMPAFPTRRFHTPITPKENFFRMCRGEKPVWVPNMGSDFNVLQPEVMPDATARSYGGTDWFGIKWKYEPLSAAAMVEPGTRRLSNITKWKEELVWPDLSSIDWEADYKKNYEAVMDPDRPTLFVIVNGFFERTADLTSFEDTFYYLLEEQEALNEFYTKLCDFHIELIRIAKKYYHVDCITFHDDMGSQQNAFMSPSTFEEVLLPHYKRMNDAIHAEGMYINFHSCGNVGVQLPNFIKAGFDFWEGQDTCNDKTALMEKYGSSLGQTSMFLPDPSLTDEELIDEIRRKVDTLGATGRYIAWFGDMNMNRKVNGEEELYAYSREVLSR